MTKETFEHADYLTHDIEVLKEIKKAQDDKHWVAFVTADHIDSRLQQYSDELINDFKDFVNRELEKLNSEFDKL